MSNDVLTRTLHPKTRVLDASEGLVEYVASDESLDSYHEVIRAAGWRFDERFERNPVFIDSHSYWGIRDVLGRVVDWRVSDKQLIETVRWAIDVEENHLARLGFAMTAGGYLRAVSVGFLASRTYYRNRDMDDFTRAMDELGLEGDARDKARVIYWEQQQIELSACVIGANPSALARAYDEGAVSRDMLDGCGLRGDEGREMLALASRAFEATTDSAVRDLVRLQLRQFAGRNISVGRGSSAGSHGGHGSARDLDRQRSHQRRWLKEVAERM